MKLTIVAAIIALTTLIAHASRADSAPQPAAPAPAPTIQSSPITLPIEISSVGGGATNPWRSPYKTAAMPAAVVPFN
ncbi:MAG TPA: hypothetical protein VGN88_11535 [Phycisphaerae bacterium]|jgi:hypothetical protein